ncbi:hypothetical protein FOXYSP1_06807 [Fusarium oxysporum f. sp. phaseoli]
MSAIRTGLSHTCNTIIDCAAALDPDFPHGVRDKGLCPEQKEQSTSRFFDQSMR